MAHTATRLRGARLLLAAALAVAAFLTFSPTSHAAFAWSGAEDVSETSVYVCAGSEEGGPCYYVNVIVYGNGRVVSTAADNEMRVTCPPANGFNCTTNPWFNWVDFHDPAMIEFTATPNATPAGTVFLGWGNQTTLENGCDVDNPEDDPPRIHQPAPNVCRHWASDFNGNQARCLEAHFSTGQEPPVGPTGGCAHEPTAPVGNPVTVTKTGSGQANGTVTSTPAGINCGSGLNCSASFKTPATPPADTVTLTATVGANTTFTGWSGGPCSGTAPCTWTMQENTPYNISANFVSSSPPPPPPPPVKLQTALLNKPKKSASNRTARFDWGAKRNGQYVSGFKSQCKLDKAKKWTTCRSGKTYRSLKRGTHTFRLRVGDSHGWDPTPAVWTWKIRK